MKSILFILIISFNFCLNAKKAPFDLGSNSLFLFGLVFLINDTTPPNVTVSNLKSKGTLESGYITGTSSDNVAVASVEIQINSGSYAMATGTTSWKYTFPVTAKWTYAFTNTINIRVKDTNGNFTIYPLTNIQKGENKDINGDGFLDLIVGAKTYNADQGRVYVFKGSASGIIQSAAGNADQIFTGSNTSQFGRYLANSDFNNDGFGDLLVCSSVYNTANNKANLYLGSESGLTLATTFLPPSGSNTEFCSAVFGADFNGDGYTDIVISDTSYNTGTIPTGNNGYTYIYNGSASGFSTSPTMQLVIGGSISNFGIRLAVGDINGDGFSDLIGTTSGNTNLYIFFGSSSGLSTSFSSFSTATTNPVILLSDLNGDGKADLILSETSFNSNTGRILIYFSNGNTISTTASVTITGDNPSYSFAQNLTTSDFNNDGINDLFVGNSSAQSSQGYMYVFLSCTNIGPCKGSGVAGTVSDLKIVGTAAGYEFGSYIGYRDLNNDGFNDLIVGAQSHFATVASQGGVYIFNGSSNSITASSNTSATKLIIGEAIAGKFGGTGN